LAPVIKELEKHPDEIISKVCVTAQHREMLDPFLEFFNIKTEYDLDIINDDQTLFEITTNILIKLKDVLDAERPDIALVQGDTTTSFIASLAAYYLKIKIGHIEAGLRSCDKYNPFPEEMNRKLIDMMADLFFVPTESAKSNLLREGVDESRIFLTGNTVIDALITALRDKRLSDRALPIEIKESRRLIFVTGHRRESFGEGLENICQALRQIAGLNDEVEIVYPVHLNPNVQKTVSRILGGIDRIHLIKPLDYFLFVKMMKRAYMILTDSGGVQEEAPYLDKPVLVMRNVTERPEVIEAGAAKLVGTKPESIAGEAQRLLTDKEEYFRMASAPNPYGDGRAAEKIIKILIEDSEKNEN